MVTSEEIEELIVKLHNEHKTTREISKEVHKNYSFIGAVLRKRFPEEYSNSNEIGKETQALKLFSEKKTPTQVAIELSSSTEETEKFYTNFWRLERLYELYRIYKEHKSRLRLFLYFIIQLKKRKVMSRKDFDDILRIIDTNHALDEEIEDFNTNVLPRLINGEGLSADSAPSHIVPN